jgi:negative regulator of sigma E activity
MTDQRRFGESDHEPLQQDDILKQAIGEWREELPSRDLWQGVAARIREHQQPVVATQRFFTFTIAQLAVAASLLIAVASGLTWMIARPQPESAAATGPVIQAYGVPEEETSGQIVQANFADAQFNAAVDDLEQILRNERDRLDPRTVLIIERNLKAIDAAINEARMALNDDPANPYLNSHLADARRRKLDLLRTATTLASAGGD